MCWWSPVHPYILGSRVRKDPRFVPVFVWLAKCDVCENCTGTHAGIQTPGSPDPCSGRLETAGLDGLLGHSGACSSRDNAQASGRLKHPVFSTSVSAVQNAWRA